MPWRVFLAGGAKAGAVDVHVVLPVFSLLDVGAAEFSVFIRILDAGDETLALLLLGKVERNLHYSGAVAVQVFFQLVDRVAAVGPEGGILGGLGRQA